jgi:hypothetical protein
VVRRGAGEAAEAARPPGKPECELRVSRIIVAPTSGAFAAFADARKLAEWSGFSGLAWTKAEVPDRREGYPAVLEAQGVLPGVLIGGDPAARLRLEFWPHPGGKTRLELRQSLVTSAQKVAAGVWWSAALERLGTYLSAY